MHANAKIVYSSNILSRFLGYFQPQQDKPALWELDSDQHYHDGKHGPKDKDEDGRYVLGQSNALRFDDLWQIECFVDSSWEALNSNVLYITSRFCGVYLCFKKFHGKGLIVYNNWVWVMVKFFILLVIYFNHLFIP